METNTDTDPIPTDTSVIQGGIKPSNVSPSPISRLQENKFYIPPSEINSTTSSILTQEIQFGVDKDFLNMSDTRNTKAVDLIELELVEFLDRLVPDIDLFSDKPHEIYEGLASQHIKSWVGFILMGDDIIDDMTRPHRHLPIPLSSNSVRTLKLIKQWMNERSDANDENADDIHTYSGEEYIKYVKSINRIRRNAVQQAMRVTSTPISRPHSATKSIGEKKYEAWSQSNGKRTKSSFEPLKNDDQYRIWKPLFDAELAHQKLAYVMDPLFDPSLITCTYEKELWKEQTAYLWTIMLHVFKNPLGRSCITRYMSTTDPRAVFFEHHKLQEESPAKSFNTSIHLSALNELSIKNFNGSRVDFIATWFEELRQLNELSTETLNYNMTKGLLLKALQGDPKLPDVFTTLVDTNDKLADIEKLRTTLLHQASLYDGKDKYLKTNINANYTNSAVTDESTDLSMIVYRATRGPPNPEARLPDQIFNSLDANDKNAWRHLPESTRIKFSRMMQAQHKSESPTDRRIYQHEIDLHRDSSTANSEITTDDSTIVNSIRQIFANAASTGPTRSKADPSNNVPPPLSKFSRSTASSVRTPKSSLKSPGKPPLLLSNMDPAHPAALLASKQVELYDKEGVYFGHVNPKPNSLNLNFHRWYTKEDELIDLETNDSITPEYRVSSGRTANQIPQTLIDRGANGCVAGSDCRWMGKRIIPRNVSITGIDNHQLTNIPVGTVGAYVISNRGPVICIFNEVAFMGRNRSILSSFQMEHHGNDVDEKHPALGGKGTISTPDGYIFPLSFAAGLAYINMRSFTDDEYQKLPHVIMTSDKDWDPTVFDKHYDINALAKQMSQELHLLPHKDYDLTGEYIHHHEVTSNQHPVIANGHVTFTELIDTNGFVTDHTQPSETSTDFAFWINDEEYQHLETINRCVKEAAIHNQDIAIYESEIKTMESPRIHTPVQRDYESLKPNFTWIPTKLIKATFKNSTQYGYQPVSPDGNLFKRWKSPNPAMNVFRLQDDLLTDMIYSDTEALDNGHTKAQIFFGRKSHIIHVEPISNTFPFIKCLQNFVRKWGAPDRLLGDHAGNQTSHRVMDYLRLLWIGFWCSEAYYKHQNMFERRYQTFKRIVNRTMDRTNTPPELWFLCMCYVAYVLNRVSDPSLHNRQPIFVATGRIGDISSLLPFHWLEPVYYRLEDTPFPSSPTEHLGYWVGIAEHVGHDMTYNIWNRNTGKILQRSSVRTALDLSKQNKRADMLAEANGRRLIQPKDTTFFIPTDPPSDQSPPAQAYGEKDPHNAIYSTDHEGVMEINDYAEAAYLEENANGDDYLDTSHTQAKDNANYVILNDTDGNPKLDHRGKQILIKGLDHNALQGTTFIKQQDDGTSLRLRVINKVIDDANQNNKMLTRFKVKHDRTDVEDIMTYNDIMNYWYRDRCKDESYEWKFRTILSHQGPLNHKSPGYKGSKYNVEIEWENGERTFEPFNVIYEDDAISLANYARDNNLLETDGWKRLKRFAKRTKKLKRMINQAKLRSFRTSPKYMYGYRVPRTYEEAIEIDKQNANTKWTDATKLEIQQLNEYDTFIDMGIFDPGKIPTGFNRIKVHLVFAVKHDGRHKSRLVSRGDLTEVPITSVYAGVVSLRGLRMCIFLAELNGMEAYATDIGNAYLEAVTQEKVCIKAGPEFGDKEGHLLIIHKALYGLRSSGKEFGDLLASCLKELGFYPSKAEPEIFMRENDGLYEYVATYVDDLCLVMKHPEQFLKQLQSEPYNFKLKGSGPMSFHLGCGFERDNNDGTLRMNPKKYIDKMIQGYEQMFGNKPNTVHQSPLAENDHPELDTSEFLDDEGIQQYQSLIGSLQWVITIGRWDIQTAVMTLSSFRAQSRKGHLDRVKRVYGYIYKFKHFCIRFRTEEPNMTHFNNKECFDWTESVYGDHQEDIPDDAPTPLGKRVTLIHYFDANLMHDILSGKSVTGCIHLANKTPIMWYSKKQATTETATYGAEFVAGRTCIEQMIDLRNTFRYLGIPINDKSYLFGDNETMVQSSSFPYARLHKRHNILSYHYVRSMVARGFIALHHLKSANNLADILTKHWSHNSVYNLLRPIFHHSGNTASLYKDDSPYCLDDYLTVDNNATTDITPDIKRKNVTWSSLQCDTKGRIDSNPQLL